MNSARSVHIFGEAMIELSGIEENSARIGIAGDTFNTAVYLSRLGQQVHYVTAVGDCPFSDRILQTCREEKLRTDYCLAQPGGTPGLYAVSVDKNGERSFTYWRKSSAARQFFNVTGWQAAFDAGMKADLLYLSGITLSLFTLSERDRIFDLMHQTRSNGSIVAFDGNYRERGWESVDEAREAIKRAISLSTITLPTLEDEQQLFGDPSAEECAERHMLLGVEETCVKEGARGAYHSEIGWIAPPEVIKPLDTTGAGDSFNAGFLASRLNGENADEAVGSGHDLAAKVLQTAGAIIPHNVNSKVNPFA